MYSLSTVFTVYRSLLLQTAVYQNSSATFGTQVRPIGLFLTFSATYGISEKRAHLNPDVMALNLAYIIKAAKTQPQIQLF